jgi:hypothetical protein
VLDHPPNVVGRRRIDLPLPEWGKLHSGCRHQRGVPVAVGPGEGLAERQWAFRIEAPDCPLAWSEAYKSSMWWG